jgi:hypothetical protein
MQPNRRSARLAGVLGGLLGGTLAAVAVSYLLADWVGAGLRVLVRPIIWFFLVGGAVGYGIERWALARPAVSRLVLIAFAVVSPIAVYRTMLLYGLVMAAMVVAFLAATITLIVVFTKET